MKSNKKILGRGVNLVLVACGLCLLPSPAIGAIEPAQLQGLLTLARSSPQEYSTQRVAFLRTWTNRVDVVEATKAGWEAGLMALIMNSRIDHPEEYRTFDLGGPVETHGDRYGYGYVNLGGLNGVPDEASIFEQLWKGGRIAPRDREVFGIVDEYGILPEYGRQQIVSVVCGQGLKIGASVPEPLLLSVVSGGAPDDVRLMAAYFLSARETEPARAALQNLLANPDNPARVKKGALLGVAAFTPSYGWPVLRDSFDSWGHDTNHLAYVSGYKALARLPEPAARGLLRSIALNPNADQILRQTAVGYLDSTHAEKIDTFKSVLLDPSSSADLKIRAISGLTQFPGEQVRKLIEELDLKQFELRVQKSLVAAPAHVPRAGSEELRFVRAMSERTDLSPEVRQAAKEAAERF